MASTAKAVAFKEIFALLAVRIGEAAARTKAATMLINDDHHEQGFNMLLEAEQPLYEARTLLNALSLLQRAEQ